MTLRKLKKIFLSKFASAAAVLIAAIFILDRLFFPLPIDKLHRPNSVFVYSRDGQLMRCFLSPDDYWRKPVKLEDISPLLRRSVIAREDRWFFYHPGFNPISLVTAAIDNVREGKVIRGGSTITMQVARMMEPKERTVKSKIIELLRAVQLELHYSKKEILELYFNLAPYGGNIEGVGAASYFYFGKKPSELTASQAALLTSIPNSPTILRPDRSAESSIAKRDQVLKTMLDRGVVDNSEYREALEEEIGECRREAPFLAAHQCEDLAAAHPECPELYSTIDLRIQKICEGVLNDNMIDLKTKGIHNGAAVVIDNSRSRIIALVGSENFFDSKYQGQVNGAKSPRSPGSALKPFVYAMALDDGLLSPNSILSDVPVYYSGYSPENYDNEYRGAVTATEALRMSLNVPAVDLCYRVGQRKFYHLLKSGGISTLTRPYYEYGLPIILGSCEVSLLELTNIYSSFARGGLYRRYTDILGESAGDTLRLVTPEASYIISEILSGLKRPDFPSCWEFSPDIPKVAWKTGTSYGRKDAWSIGCNTKYTIGIWVGNFDGEASPYLVGADAAAPILFKIFQSLSDRDDAGWFNEPPGVSERLVCAASGMRPGRFCPSTVKELYIPGVSPEEKCELHKEIFVDDSTGCALCRFCAVGKSASPIVYEEWPPRIATWLARTGRLSSRLPEHNPECVGSPGGDSPIILSPNGDTKYILRRFLRPEQQKILLDASVASGSRNIYWFFDDLLYEKVGVGEKAFLVPREGRHKITCSDDRGRSTTIYFDIM